MKKKGDLNRKKTHEMRTKDGMVASGLPLKKVYGKMLFGNSQ